MFGGVLVVRDGEQLDAQGLALRRKVAEELELRVTLGVGRVVPAVRIGAHNFWAARGIGEKLDQQLLEHEEVGRLGSGAEGAVLLVAVFESW